MSNKTVLLTGVSGFIGGHVAAELLRDNYRILAPVRLQSIEKTAFLKPHKNLIIVQGDFYNPALLETVQGEKIDTILHFASIRGAGKGAAKEYEHINVTATNTLLEFALQNKIPNFLYCSTVGVLGTIPHKQPAGSESPVNPDNLYHQTKWQAEELVRNFSQKGLHTMVLRPTITYGSHDDGFVPKLIKLVSQGRFPLSSKKVSIHLLHVQALSRLVTDILKNNDFTNKTYIVADTGPVILKDLAEQISREIGGRCHKVPSVVFTLGGALLKFPGLNGLRTSLQLISTSWVYDIGSTVKELGYVPDETAASVGAYIKEYV